MSKPAAALKPLPVPSTKQLAQLQALRDKLDTVRAAHQIPKGSGVGYGKLGKRTPEQIAADEAHDAAFSARHDAMDAVQEEIKAFIATMSKVGKQTVVSRYDRYAPRVLTAKGVIEEVYVERAEDAKRRPQSQYVALLTWPTMEEYRAMRDLHYTATATDHVEQATSIFQDLQEQMQSWYDGMPENFQNGEKGEAVQEAASQLEDAANDTIDVPEIIAELPVIVFPGECSSRSDQCNDACMMLDKVAEAAEELKEKMEAETTYMPDWAKEEHGFNGYAVADMDEIFRAGFQDIRTKIIDALDDLAGKCREVISNAEGIEFPGMY